MSATRQSATATTTATARSGSPMKHVIAIEISDSDSETENEGENGRSSSARQDKVQSNGHSQRSKAEKQAQLQTKQPINQVKEKEKEKEKGKEENQMEVGVGVGVLNNQPQSQTSNSNLKRKRKGTPNGSDTHGLKDLANGKEFEASSSTNHKGKGKQKEIEIETDEEEESIDVYPNLRDKGKGKSRAISPRNKSPKKNLKASSSSHIINSEPDHEAGHAQGQGEEGDDSIIFIKSTNQTSSNRNKNKNKTMKSRNTKSTPSSSRSRYVIEVKSSPEPLDPLDELLQILPDLDPTFAKSHLSKFQLELSPTNGKDKLSGNGMGKGKGKGSGSGSGNEMILSRALEQLIEMKNGYPKKKIDFDPENHEQENSQEGVDLDHLSDSHGDEISQDGEGGETENVACACCFDDELPLKKLIPCSFGLHHFCPDCCRRTYEAQLGLRKSTIQCMDSSDCKATFHPREIRRFLPRKSIKLLDSIIMEKEIEQSGLKDNLETCPWCNWGCIFEVDKQAQKLLKCQGRNCGRVSCRTCKQEDHLPLSCQEYRDSKTLSSKHQMEEELTSILIRKCPTTNCSTVLIKDDGCNKMRCPKCAKFMCYVCRLQINGYDHFDQNPADYAKAKMVGKCPLWENTDDRHRLEQDEYRKRMGEKVKDVGGDAPIIDRPAGWQPSHVQRAQQQGYQILANGDIRPVAPAPAPGPRGFGFGFGFVQPRGNLNGNAIGNRNLPIDHLGRREREELVNNIRGNLGLEPAQVLHLQHQMQDDDPWDEDELFALVGEFQDEFQDEDADDQDADVQDPDDVDFANRWFGQEQGDAREAAEREVAEREAAEREAMQRALEQHRRRIDEQVNRIREQERRMARQRLHDEMVQRAERAERAERERRNQFIQRGEMLRERARDGRARMEAEAEAKLEVESRRQKRKSHQLEKQMEEDRLEQERRNRLRIQRNNNPNQEININSQSNAGPSKPRKDPSSNPNSNSTGKNHRPTIGRSAQSPISLD